MSDHARQCIVRAGRQSPNLGHQPDPAGAPIALTCEVGGSPSEPRTDVRGHAVHITTDSRKLDRLGAAVSMRPSPNEVGVPASAGPDDRIPPEGGTPTSLARPKSAADRSKSEGL